MLRVTSGAAGFWTPCWACRLVRGEPVGEIVAETADVLVALNPFPVASGHSLVFPRRHVANLYELPDSLAGPLLSMAAWVARETKRALAADGVTLRQNNDAASVQHLFHIHFHVIPRFAGDEARFSVPPVLIDAAVQRVTGSCLRTALASGRAQPSADRVR